MDLYDVLHGDVNTNLKNLIIVGTQFNEQIVFDKFFDGLNSDDIKIYHFDLKNDDVREKEQFYNRDYTFIKLEDDKGNRGTGLFLQFLSENKHKIKNISFEGALTIDQGFVDAINKGEEFSKSKFYSAKQDDNCQWYGILNDFDVVRKVYPEIKNDVLNSFSKIKIYKVAAVIHGTGGCGKSTLLRRLALELIDESGFEIIWVKNRQLENFVSTALPEIRTDMENSYLVFVEDWYRLTDENKEIGNTLLKETQAISNIRLVIGDRDITGKDYRENLVNPESIYELTTGENREILDKIIAKQTEWKQAGDLVLNNPRSCNSPLFIILFAIAGLNENRFDEEEINCADLENTVRRIYAFDHRDGIIEIPYIHYIQLTISIFFSAFISKLRPNALNTFK